MYKAYDKATIKVRQKLIEENKSTESIKCFDRCVKLFREYLYCKKKSYSVKNLLAWIDSLHVSKEAYRYFQFLIANEINPHIKKSDIYKTSIISYNIQAPPWGHLILNEFNIDLNNSKVDINACTDAKKFIIFLDKQNCNKIEDLTCSHIILYRKQCYLMHLHWFLEFLERKKIINQFETLSYSFHYIDFFNNFTTYSKNIPKSEISVDEYIKAYNDYSTQLISLDYSASAISRMNHYYVCFGIAMSLYKFNYSFEAVEIFLSYLKNDRKVTFNLYKEYKRLLFSIGYLINKEAPPIVFTNNVNKYPVWFQDYADLYQKFRKRNNIGDSARIFDRTVLLRFSWFIDDLGIQNLSDITRLHIKQYIYQDKHNSNESKSAYSVKLRMFLDFLFDNHFIDIQLSKAIPIINSVTIRPTEVIDDEIYNLILKKCEEWESVGEYLKPLVIKLELFLGVRPIDMGNLTKENISFENQELCFCQQKTNRMIKLPFPVEIGNLFYNYITKQRPKVERKQLLLYTQAPYNPIKKGFVRKAILEASNGVISKTHMLRKTFASRMLKNKTLVTDISTILGHSENTQVDTYLDTDISVMRHCGLPVDISLFL